MKRKIGLDVELLFCGFMLFLFAPLEIYFSNINNLWFTIYDFAGYLMVLFILYIAIIVLVNWLFACRNLKIYEKLVYYIFLLGLAFYIQGNFILTDYGQLDGSPINWSEYKVEGIISVGLFVLVLACGTFLLIKMRIEKVRKVTKGISVCLILIQLVTLISVSIFNDGFTKKDDYIVTTKNEWIYSSERNFNILVLDSFSSQVFNNLLNGECKKEIEELFEDFTYYRNTSTMYCFTNYSVPQIITGENYLNQETYGDYLNRSYMVSPLLKELENEGYELNIYQNVKLPNGNIVNKISNWEKPQLTVSSHRRLLEYIYKLVGFRYLPQPLKQLCWFYPDDMDDLKEINYVSGDDVAIEGDSEQAWTWGNDVFYKNIENLSASENANIFHFYHLKGLHDIRDLDKDFNKAEDVSLEETAKGMFNMLNKYFNKLQEEGIYDNSVIVIMADHSPFKIDGGETPLLLVKGVGEKHLFTVTDIPVSYSDLQIGYKNLLHQTNTDNIFEIQDENRKRYLYHTELLSPSLNNDEYGANFVEYVIEGHVFDNESIKKTGKVYSHENDE